VPRLRRSFAHNDVRTPCVPQQGDALLYDAAIHTSVHNGARTSRIAPRLRRSFAHNNVRTLHAALHMLRAECSALEKDESSVFVAVESVYSMDGTIALLHVILNAMDQVFPAGNVHLVVDEAHAMGIYGPGAHGIVALLAGVLALSVYLYLYPGGYLIPAKPSCTRTLTRTNPYPCGRSRVFTGKGTGSKYLPRGYPCRTLRSWWAMVVHL
jgi:8-amino-7-oxononanoate synthase